MVEQLKVAENTLTMARLFNIRQGLTYRHNRLPLRFFEPKTDDPAAKGLDVVKKEQAKQYYYALMS